MISQTHGDNIELLSISNETHDNHSKVNETLINNKTKTRVHTTKSTTSEFKSKKKKNGIIDEPKGDPITTKMKGSLRFLYQNVNGLRELNDGKWKLMIEIMKDLDCDIIGMTETCINWRLKNIKQQYQQTLSKVFKNSSLIVSTLPIVHQKLYLPGGTTTAVTGQWSSKIQTQLFDNYNMGRWTGVRLTISDKSKLHMITGYRVCDTKMNITNSMSSFSQQYMILTGRGVEKPDPRQQFINDIIQFIKSLNITKNEYLIFALDANNSSEHKQEGIAEIIESCDLVDLYTTKHEDYSDFPTHENGSKKIDYLLCTKNLLPYITKVGYLHYDEGFPSDHRAIYCDISSEILSKNIQNNPPRERLVGTNSTNKEGIKYISSLDKAYKKLNIYEEVDKIFNDSKSDHLNNTQTEECMILLNKLDKTITEIMLRVESITCSKKSSALWSPCLREANLVVKFWKVVRNNHKKGKNNKEKYMVIFDKLSTKSQAAIYDRKISIKSSMKKAVKHYYYLLSMHRELRKEYLNQQLEDINKRGSEKVKTTMKSLLAREQSRQDFKLIRQTFKPSGSFGINRIEVPDKDNNTKYVTISDPNQYKKILIERNINHFGQAAGTPFTSYPIKKVFGYSGTTQEVENLVKNRVLDKDLEYQPKYINDILQKLKDGKNLEEFNEFISFEEFLAGLLKWKEKTTTSPSGRHLGHYKLLTRLPVFEDEEKTSNLSLKILELYYKVAMTTAKLGSTLTRWTKIATCMIEKIKGCPRIDKLRVIHLFEADYNLILKIIWARKLVWNLHTTNSIHDGQSGSRPGKRAIDVVIQKEMKYLYSHLTRTQLGTVDNDAKSCYDRIICNLAMAISGYYGVPGIYRKMLAETLEKSKYHLRAATGDSSEYYQHTEDNNIHGTGQGSCASPPIWLIISSLLMTILEKHSYGMTMIDIENTKKIIKAIEGFVDDTSLFCNTNFECESLIILLKRLCHDSSYWSGLLEATGGNAIPKSINKQKLEQEKLVITTKEGTIIPIQQRDINESHKTLGTFKTITGNEDSHIDYLIKKSNKYSIDICHSQLNRRQANTAFNMNYIPAVSYSLVSMCLSEKQLDIVQKQAIGSFLQKMGYEKLFPRAAVYGPVEYGGLGIKNLYVHSVCQKIDTLMNHVNSKSTLSELMIMNLGWVQINIGTSTPLLQTRHIVDYLPRNWFISIQEFLREINGQIMIKNTWCPELQRMGDFNIMDAVIKLNMTTFQTRIFNNWRIYFQVLTLADLTNTEGNLIQTHYLEKKKLRNFVKHSMINWPKQEQPDEKYFSIWTTTIRNITSCKSKNLLKKALGVWIINPHKYKVHNQVINNKLNEIRVRTDKKDEWLIYQQYDSKWSQISYKFIRTIEWDGKNLHKYIPCNAKFNDNNTIILNSREVKKYIKCKLLHEPRIENNLIQFITSNNKWYKNLIENTQQINANFEVLTENNVYNICCDGGVRNNEAGIGVVVQINGIEILHNKVRVQTTFNDINSYRAEGFGIITAFLLYLETKQYLLLKGNKNNRKDELTIYCDNKSIVDKINTFKQSVKKSTKFFSTPDSDILLTIAILLHQTRRLYGNVKLCHVKGHQDSCKSTNLSNEAMLNIQADRLATESLRLKKVSTILQPSTQSTIHVNDKQITAKRYKLLSLTYNSIKLHQHFKLSNDWSDKTIEDIWWRIHNNALKKFNKGNNVTLKKLIFKRLPCNAKENRYYPYKTPYCNTCHTEIETMYHVLQCNKCQLRKTERERYTNNMRYKLEEMRTDDAVTRIIIANIEAWLNDLAPPNIRTLVDDPSKALIKAVTSQNKIGWDNWFKGRISIEWAHMYNYVLKNTEHGLKNMTAERWGTKLIEITYMFVLNSWILRNNMEHDADGNPEEMKKYKNCV